MGQPSPPLRVLHVDAGLGDSVVIFSGSTHAVSPGTFPGQVHEDTWVFNATTQLWRQINTTVHPEGRVFAGMAGVAFGGKRFAILFGGQTLHKVMDDCWSFDVSIASWRLLVQILPVMTGLGPSPRLAHAFSSDFSNNVDTKIAMQGGLTTGNQLLTDLWTGVLVSETQIAWNHVSLQNPVPLLLQASLFTSQFGGVDTLFLFGGLSGPLNNQGNVSSNMFLLSSFMNIIEIGCNQGEYLGLFCELFVNYLFVKLFVIFCAISTIRHNSISFLSSPFFFMLLYFQ